MKLTDILETVVDFPKKYKKSRIIGKTPEGYNVEIDEITGAPCVIHNGICYFVDPKTFELGPEFDPEAEHEPGWAIVDDEWSVAVKYFPTKREAELEAEKLRRWEGRSVNVIEV